ncbi:hypothetical protein GGTG_03506 [Gaeumannomyces tritici R3-111a-1]|uniref:Uncharacterized protein n=1 Tax=Gaeumannomyces tritici (strain R3-111a-1) TaxID=644352 RepID=J3NQE9_GAET3|nr:hypothetical protein GGTG_03506 [Gaeumannomyces tritici R3-111a-1]EJT78405.1 hypothetical protein GGTG_03506 [Gaeumannomyces tritici R3-111a-1]
MPTWEEAQNTPILQHTHIPHHTCFPFGDAHYILPAPLVDPPEGKSAFEFYATRISRYHEDWRNRFPNFGDAWEFLFGPNTERDLRELHDDARIEMLIVAEVGSNCPRFRETLAGVNEPPLGLALDGDERGDMAEGTIEEQARILTVRGIQVAIKARLLEGKAMSWMDAGPVLRDCGESWYQGMPLFRIAVDTMKHKAPRLG